MRNLVRSTQTFAERLEAVKAHHVFYHFNVMNEAWDAISRFIRQGKPFGIVGDYDVDGICGSAILTKLLNYKGANLLTTRLPRRFSEGYGLSVSIVDELHALGVEVLLTVDNGIAAIDAIKKAKEYGMFVIVLDHHLQRDDGLLPEADILVDPKVVSGQAAWHDYCGAGLAWKLASFVLTDKKDEPLFEELTALAAIATIADSVTVLEENRIIIKKGLKLLSEKELSMGLNCLLAQAGLEGKITSKNIGYKIAPMLNAPGRLIDDGASISLALLLEPVFQQSFRLATRLHELNEQRKELVEKDSAMLLNSGELVPGKATVVIIDGHEGLVGIDAAKIVERTLAPAIVFAETEIDGVKYLKGSARSVPGVHVKEMLDKISHLLVKYGGHAAAAGLTIKADDFEAFKTAFVEVCGTTIPDDVIVYDAEIDVQDVEEVLANVARLEPFGPGNEEPVFVVRGFWVSPRVYRMQNGKSIKLTSENGNLNALGFGMAAEVDAADVVGKPITIVGNLSWNFFRGTATPQIEMMGFTK